MLLGIECIRATRVSSIAATVSLVTGRLAVRFNHRPLLLATSSHFASSDYSFTVRPLFSFSQYIRTICATNERFSNWTKSFKMTENYTWNNLPKPNVIFVLGGPGAGKGTQCALICKEFGFVHLSAGDLLRKEQNIEGSHYGQLIDEHIRNGTIVPVEITCSLLEQAMLDHMITLATSRTGGDEPIPVGNFLIDGFPRNQNNLDGWTKQVNDKVNVKYVIFFECPKEVCIDRCLRRGQHSGRADDNEESMKKRLDTYLNQTMPIVEHYERLNYVKRIDASRDIQQVFDDVRKLFS